VSYVYSLGCQGLFSGSFSDFNRGYGGLGRTPSQDTMNTDAGRSALFGDAPKRQQQPPAQQPGGYGGGGGYDSTQGGDRSALFGNAPNRQPQPGGYGGGGGYDSTQSGAYGAPSDGQVPGGCKCRRMNFTKHVLTGVIDGAYGDRELTAEEQEEEDISATKNEIKFMKQQDVSSTRNALRLAQQAEESGRDTLQRLGAQGERIHNTERNLDMASSQVCSTRPPHIGLEC
jgi:hypothetical protein